VVAVAAVAEAAPIVSPLAVDVAAAAVDVVAAAAAVDVVAVVAVDAAVAVAAVDVVDVVAVDEMAAALVPTLHPEPTSSVAADAHHEANTVTTDASSAAAVEEAVVEEDHARSHLAMYSATAGAKMEDHTQRSELGLWWQHWKRLATVVAAVVGEREMAEEVGVRMGLGIDLDWVVVGAVVRSLGPSG
jgi:hypothetical protein